MELAEKYIYKIYQENSFSKAARKLYISQSSLSTTVKKHENKLGFSIFDRSKSPIALTREGKIYITYLEEAIENENTMLSRIKAITKPSYAQVSVGGTFFITKYLLPRACSTFYHAFPDVDLKINMCEASSYANLFQRLDAGILQLVIGYTFDESKYDVVPLAEEKYVVCMRRDFPGAADLAPYALSRSDILSGNDFPDKRISDYNLFGNISFLRIHSESIFWQDMAKFLAHCPAAPFHIYSCRNIEILYDMMLCGMGAAITTDFIIASRPQSDDVLYFLIDTPKKSCQSHIIYKKGTSLSESAKAFITALCETARRKGDTTVSAK